GLVAARAHDRLSTVRRRRPQAPRRRVGNAPALVPSDLLSTNGSGSIEAILFDFGGVFTESPFLAAREAGDELGIDVDVAFDLCHAGVRKPDPRIYRLALDAVDVDAEAAVFLDDHPANVEAAEALGMRGIVVGRDRMAAFDRLEELLAAGE